MTKTVTAPAAGLSYCGSPADQGGISVNSHTSCPFSSGGNYVEFPSSGGSAPVSGQFADLSTLTQSVTSEQQAALAAAPSDDCDSSDDASVSVLLTPLGDNTYSATATDTDGDTGSGYTVTVSTDGSSWSDTGMNWSGPDIYSSGGTASYWTTPPVSGHS